MTHLIDPIEKTGLFRFCGKCPMCLKYFNPEDPPETGYFSNPMIRGQYLLSKDMRRDRKEYQIKDTKSFEKFKKHQDIKNNDKVIFFEDSVENLLASKKIDRITIYIGPHNVSQFKSINKQFTTIEESLEFIIDKNNIVTRRLQYQKDHS